MTTTNLSDFGRRELGMLTELLQHYAAGRYSHPFWSDSGVQAMMNRNSGFVFLIDDEYNVLMMNGYDLEGFYTLPDSGIEGFLDELLDYKKQVERKGSQLDADDVKFLQDLQNRI